MLPRQDLAEGAPYRLPDHGRVEVALIDDAAGVVYCEALDTGTQPAPMYKVSIDDFRARADPLPVTVAVPTTDVATDTHL